MAIRGQVAYNIWIKLPEEVRHKLVVLFDIPRSGRTVVEYRATGPTVTSDGYTPLDIEAITIEKMNGLLGSESNNFYGQFEQICDNIDALMDGSYGKNGPAHKRFCEFCDSKGVKHKKGCPSLNHGGEKTK